MNKLICMHSKTELDRNRKRIEEMGVFFEKFYIPPVPSRVLAYLLAMDPPYSSFNEIQEFLLVSKSSINKAIKFLIKEGRINYFTKAGDRTKYFKIDPESWVLLMQERVKAWGTSTKLIEKALANRGEEHKEFNNDLKLIVEFETFLQDKWEEHFEYWNQNVSLESYLDEDAEKLPTITPFIRQNKTAQG